jgi:uncharacterized membrane protein
MLMNSAQLKILACVFMLIDHIGAVLYPDMRILRIIGRLAFPIFVFLIAEGYRRTKDITDYMGRLLVFALISQLAFNAAFLGSATKPDSLYLNVLFTLVMGLYGIYIYDKHKNLFHVILIAVICELLHTDYGAFGVILVFVSHKYHDNFSKLTKSYVFLMMLYVVDWIVSVKVSNPSLSFRDIIFSYFTIEPIALLSLIFIKFYNGQRGFKLRYLFYSFYPAHLFILSLIDKLK